jgi:hypothetical protein
MVAQLSASSIPNSKIHSFFIPQSEIRNREPTRRVGVRRTNPKGTRSPPITGLLLIGPFPGEANVSLVPEISALQ